MNPKDIIQCPSMLNKRRQSLGRSAAQVLYFFLSTSVVLSRVVGPTFWLGLVIGIGFSLILFGWLFCVIRYLMWFERRMDQTVSRLRDMSLEHAGLGKRVNTVTFLQIIKEFDLQVRQAGKDLLSADLKRWSLRTIVADLVARAVLQAAPPCSFYAPETMLEHAETLWLNLSHRMIESLYYHESHDCCGGLF